MRGRSSPVCNVQHQQQQQHWWQADMLGIAIIQSSDVHLSAHSRHALTTMTVLKSRLIVPSRQQLAISLPCDRSATSVRILGKERREANVRLRVPHHSALQTS